MNGTSTARTARWQQYHDRIQRVLEYIRANPTGDLSNDRLAEVACLSSYHWHRIYRAITGETTTATAKRFRMQRAAMALLRSDRPVADIGADCGYPEVHSFTRTFKAHYGVPPGRFRELHQLPSSGSAAGSAASVSSDRSWPVRFEQRPDRTLYGLWHQGDYNDIGATFEKVVATAMTEGWLHGEHTMAGVYFHDPEAVASVELKSFAGLVLPPENRIESRLERWSLQGGRFAIARYQGPYANLDRAYRWLYTDWLRDADVSVRDQPCAEHYLNNPRDTPIEELLTDIALPLEV